MVQNEPCDCTEAAEAVREEIVNAYKLASEMAGNNAVASSGIPDLPATKESREAEEARNKWMDMQPKFLESFKNKEGMDNMGIMEYIKDGIAARHSAFRETTSFSKDCELHGYTIINDFLKQEKSDLDKLLKYYKSFLKDYEALYQYKSSVSNIINSKNKELNKLQDKIDKYKQNLLVDDRKNNYKQENYEFYKNIWFYLLIVYYSIFVIYLIFSNFFKDKLYLNKKVVIFMGIYLIIPIILRFFLNLLVKTFIYYLESNNIKQEVKSYTDIIKNNDKSSRD